MHYMLLFTSWKPPAWCASVLFYWQGREIKGTAGKEMGCCTDERVSLYQEWVESACAVLSPHLLPPGGVFEKKSRKKDTFTHIDGDCMMTETQQLHCLACKHYSISRNGTNSKIVNVELLDTIQRLTSVFNILRIDKPDMPDAVNALSVAHFMLAWIFDFYCLISLSV